jgi:hypothetical protein
MSLSENKLNREKLVSSIRSLRFFIDESLCLSYGMHKLTGFEYSSPILEAIVYNAYIETIGNKADSLYLRIKESLTSMVTHSYLDYIQRLSNIFDWKNKKVMLAFDYTDENFYGDITGFDIHGCKPEKGVKGKFKFLTCSIVSDDIPEKIPLISVPIRLGHYKSHVIKYCLEKISNFIGEIELILFDRGYFDKDLMYELSKSNYPYLIFVPKSEEKKSILFPLEKGEKIAYLHNFKVNKDKSNFEGETYLTFLKQIYDPKSEKEYDWVFATNVNEIVFSNIIATYKKRWRIETGFRVQDEAKIKCKSKNMKIRYFFFVIQQILQSQWMCFYKEEVTFKRYLIEVEKTCKTIVKNPKRSFKRNLNV